MVRGALGVRPSDHDRITFLHPRPKGARANRGRLLKFGSAASPQSEPADGGTPAAPVSESPVSGSQILDRLVDTSRLNRAARVAREGRGRLRLRLPIDEATPRERQDARSSGAGDGYVHEPRFFQ
jgi:hypothetical protein